MAASINQAQFDELKDLLGDEFTQMVEQYIQDSRGKLDAVQAAYQAQDNQKGYEAIHSLKGASANLGAAVLPGLCLQLQNECRAGRISEADVLIQTIEQAWEQLTQDLRVALAS